MMVFDCGWLHREQALKEFHEQANRVHEDIKIELRYDRCSIEFLDTWVRLKDGMLETDLYVKPTDIYDVMEILAGCLKHWVAILY